MDLTFFNKKIGLNMPGRNVIKTKKPLGLTI